MVIGKTELNGKQKVIMITVLLTYQMYQDERYDDSFTNSKETPMCTLRRSVDSHVKQFFYTCV